MFESPESLVAYVGSAALVAFLAVCMSSPKVATFTCNTSGANGAQKCELASLQPAGIPETDQTNTSHLRLDDAGRDLAASAASQ